jgi:hypothetical protein
MSSLCSLYPDVHFHMHPMFGSLMSYLSLGMSSLSALRVVRIHSLFSRGFESLSHASSQTASLLSVSLHGLNVNPAGHVVALNLPFFLHYLLLLNSSSPGNWGMGRFTLCRACRSLHLRSSTQSCKPMCIPPRQMSSSNWHSAAACWGTLHRSYPLFPRSMIRPRVCTRPMQCTCYCHTSSRSCVFHFGLGFEV